MLLFILLVLAVAYWALKTRVGTGGRTKFSASGLILVVLALAVVFFLLSNKGEDNVVSQLVSQKDRLGASFTQIFSNF